MSDAVGSPSAFSWPAILSKKLNIPHVNLGIPGAGNLEILYNILNYDIEPDDIVIVMWSFISRDFIFNQNGEHVKIGLWKQDDQTKSWLDIHNFYDLTVRSFLYVHHADYYLRGRCKAHLHSTVGFRLDKGVYMKPIATPLFAKDIDIIDLGNTFKSGSKLKDGHPDETTYASVADIFYDRLSGTTL